MSGRARQITVGHVERIAHFSDESSAVCREQRHNRETALFVWKDRL